MEVVREIEEGDNESGSEDSDRYDKRTLDKRMHKIDFEKFLMVPEKIYYISFKCGSGMSGRNSNASHIKCNNRVYTNTDSKTDTTFKFILGSDQKDALLIGGLVYEPKSCFS